MFQMLPIAIKLSSRRRTLILEDALTRHLCLDAKVLVLIVYGEQTFYGPSQHLI